MNNLKSRTSEIIVQTIDDEVFIYDLMDDRCYCLNPTLAKIYDACNGTNSVDEIAVVSGLTPEMTSFGINELAKNKLLEDSSEMLQPTLTRREVVKKLGLASLTALPILTILVAPTAATATSICFPGTCGCTFSVPPASFPPLLGKNCATTPGLMLTTRCPNPVCTCYAAAIGLPDNCKP